MSQPLRARRRGADARARLVAVGLALALACRADPGAQPAGEPASHEHDDARGGAPADQDEAGPSGGERAGAGTFAGEGGEITAPRPAEACHPELPIGLAVGERLDPELLSEVMPGRIFSPSCERPPTVLLITLQAGFCGTCRLFAARFPELSSAEARRRTTRVDVLLTDELDDPAGPAAAAAWQERAGRGVIVTAAPDTALLAAFPERTTLPLALLLDERTLEILALIEGAWPSDVSARIERALARLDGVDEPSAESPELRDGRFSEDEWSLLEDMSLNRLALPADPTNQYADNPFAVGLGKALFLDPTFSANGAVSCASCHERRFMLGNPDPTPPQGIGPASRNAPTLAFAAFSPRQFWDGRSDTLWGQATRPVEASLEMGFTRLEVLRRLVESYREQVARSFGELPTASELEGLPAAAMPGMAAWQLLSPAQQAQATRALVIYGKAVAAFERSLRTTPLGLDIYLAGERRGLRDEQKDGLLAFVESGCPQCHYGPRLTDDAFHVLRAASGRDDLRGDAGRLEVLGSLGDDPMRAAGPFSDAPDAASPTPRLIHPGLLGAFKTPALRGVASTAPYGHGGGEPTLAAMVELHRVGGLPSESRLALGKAERWLTPFSETERNRIVTFLESLPLTLQEF